MERKPGRTHSPETDLRPYACHDPDGNGVPGLVDRLGGDRERDAARDLEPAGHLELIRVAIPDFFASARPEVPLPFPWYSKGGVPSH